MVWLPVTFKCPAVPFLLSENTAVIWKTLVCTMVSELLTGRGQGFGFCWKHAEVGMEDRLLTWAVTSGRNGRAQRNERDQGKM